jgi:peptidylprolyl isomerase
MDPKAITYMICLLTPISIAAAQTWRDLPPASTLVIDTTKGRMVVEMRPDFAPDAVARVKLLAREHVYDGLLFHRVIDRYVDQTGNPNNRDGGVSKYRNLPPEFTTGFGTGQLDTIATNGPEGISGFVGAMPFQASPDPARPGRWRAWAAYCGGVAGMGREADPGSANSEIFFMRAPSRSLDHDYTPWGRVISGLETVTNMAVGEPPAHPDVMIKVQVMADMPVSDRPRLQVIDTKSASFKQEIASLRQQFGADFSVCDVPIPVQAMK